jgi:signal transduction histidine kinase
LSAASLHPLSLRFADAGTERDYLAYDFPRMVSQGRIAMIIGTICYLSFGLFDHALFAAEVRSTVWGIRLTALLAPALVMVLSFHRWFRRANYLPLALVGMAAGVGIIITSMHMSPEMQAYYYPAMILVAFYTYNLIGTRFVYALAVDVSLFALYNLAILWRGDIAPTTLAVHDFYIVTANLIGGGAGYLTELQRRKLFETETHVRVEMEKALAARREADFANVAKSRFLAAVSHDLRQPIHAQGLFLNVLARTELTSKQQEIVANIGAASAAAGDMLHTLMDFSRIEAGAITPSVHAFPLQPLLNKIEKEFTPQADAKGLRYRSRESGLVVRSDPALVEMILRNLVSNAIRYTPRGAILLACRKRQGNAVLEVFDTGIGIPASQHQEVFREFHQLGNPERDRHKGLGLGLSIVKGLAQTLGHPLGLDSVPGRGSVFRLSLPIADAVEVEPEKAGKDLLARRADIRILLVEDDEAVRLGTQQQLLDWGFECDAVECIESAQAAADKQPPSLVISDFRLRNHSTGADVIAALRARLDHALPALLITGDTAPERIREARSHGIPLLHKPVAPSDLYRGIVTALEGA